MSPPHPLAGAPAPMDVLVDVPRLVTAYFAGKPDPSDPAQAVAFGTSGHRGSSLKTTFNEAHILAITQAICDFRREAGVTGPLFLGVDTHALSEPARVTALEVLAANGVTVVVDAHDRPTPTPVISHAILTHNRDVLAGAPGAHRRVADGIVITPSHNPPEDGGFKYNPPHGGPADGETTRQLEAQANALLRDGLRGVKRTTLEKALAADTTQRVDFVTPYVDDLGSVLDLEVVARAGVRIGVDPMGGSGIALWEPIAERYGLRLEVVNPHVDPTFRFMTLDRDGRIRMDCSSPFAMASLIGLKDRFDIAFGNDTDYDRHGIVAPSVGLLNPNHYLAVAIDYLFRERAGWPAAAMVGKTLVSSSMIDRVAKDLGRGLAEVPVGFKWFVELLRTGEVAFGGEESAGASFLRRDGGVWTTDKDGVILGLLAAEMTAKRGKDPGELYRELTARFGEPIYERIDAPASPAQKAVLQRLSPGQVSASELAGEPIVQKLTRSPHGDYAIGGLKVTTESGWFAARPSGTEDVYKIYAESFRGEAHLRRIQDEAQAIVERALETGP